MQVFQCFTQPPDQFPRQGVTPLGAAEDDRTAGTVDTYRPGSEPGTAGGFRPCELLLVRGF